jgi:hypothetical protein
VTLAGQQDRGRTGKLGEPLGLEPDGVDQHRAVIRGEQVAARDRTADAAVSDPPVPDAGGDLFGGLGDFGRLGHAAQPR